MSPRPSSLFRRSDANPRRGNELGSRSNMTEPNSNSGGTRDTSPERQQRDHGQGAADSQMSSGQQPTSRGHTNAERNGPGDLGNQKRKLNQALTEFSRSSKKSKSDSDSNLFDIDKLHSRARGMLRFIGPFIQVRSTFKKGYELASPASTSEASSGDPNLDQAIWDIYQKILAFIPGLEEHVEWTRINDPSKIDKLAGFLEQGASRGRSDDCGSLREDAIGYIRPVEGIPELDRLATKETRGFRHHMTARLLCPRHLRDKFDEDRQAFCDSVENARRFITHNDWPSFLYPEDGYNPGAIDDKLLQSPLLVSCYRNLFTGPRTAMREEKGKAPGKRCIADIYGMTKVTPVTIAYVAVVVRFVLNSKVSWSVQDGRFNAKGFFQNIMGLFDDKDWAEETLAWWTSWVFGDDHTLNNTPRKDDESTVASLNAQRAARRMAAASGSAQEFEQEVQESELVVEEPESAGEEPESAGDGPESASEGPESVGEEYHNENLSDEYN